jgi:hypothetical protein
MFSNSLGKSVSAMRILSQAFGFRRKYAEGKRAISYQEREYE